MENVFSILFCLTLFYVAVTYRVKAYVTILAIQGALLTFLLFIPLLDNFNPFSVILPLTIFVVKGVVIPIYINKIILKLDVKRKIEPTIEQISFLSLVILTIVLTFVFSIYLSSITKLEIIPFAVGFSSIFTGIYIIMFRKKLIVHVCGFLVMENGIFLLSTVVASELPMTIELGVMLDLFVVVFLMGIALNRIKSTFSGFEVTHLDRLKD
ncbi:MAG TPA: hypothetical protein PL041_12620 [Melioribacteraceae bacterium]|nr:hypothetical protein [Melioribacteraceae bacterium]